MVSPALWKLVLATGLFFAFIAFILGWVGFGVPEWHEFQRYNGSTEEYYGLWAYCQESAPYFSSVCKRWPTAEDILFNGTRPNFVRTADGLITVGMILLSFGLIAAVFAAILPMLAYVAGGIIFLAFLFLIIGIPIFGRQSNKLSETRGDATHGKRYGFGLMIATIVLSFIASILFLITGFLYQKFGFGNLASKSYSKNPTSGQQVLGASNTLGGMPFAATAGLNPYNNLYNPYNPYQYQPIVGLPAPSLLSQYIARRMPRYYGPVAVQRTVVTTTLPQPSATVSSGAASYVSPAYYRAPIVSRPNYAPAVNLTGQALAGPAVRYT